MVSNCFPSAQSEQIELEIKTC